MQSPETLAIAACAGAAYSYEPYLDRWLRGDERYKLGVDELHLVDFFRDIQTKQLIGNGLSLFGCRALADRERLVNIVLVASSVKVLPTLSEHTYARKLLAFVYTSISQHVCVCVCVLRGARTFRPMTTNVLSTPISFSSAARISAFLIRALLYPPHSPRSPVNTTRAIFFTGRTATRGLSTSSSAILRLTPYKTCFHIP